MDKIRISGNANLFGSIITPGSKNAALPIMVFVTDYHIVTSNTWVIWQYTLEYPHEKLEDWYLVRFLFKVIIVLKCIFHYKKALG